MGYINFHKVTEAAFNNSASKNNEHLYFVQKESYIDLYKGSVPIGNPNTIKNGEDASLANITASGTVKIGNAILSYSDDALKVTFS